MQEQTRKISLDVKPEIYNRIDSYCAERGCTQDWLILRALDTYLAEYFEDKADYEDAVSAWNEYERSGCKSYTAEEVFKEAGL